MDKYADLRATLERNATLKMSQAFYPDTIRALLADADRATALEAANARLREALKTMVEMVEMNGFGKDYAIDMARAALAHEQGGNDATTY